MMLVGLNAPDRHEEGRRRTTAGVDDRLENKWILAVVKRRVNTLTLPKRLRHNFGNLIECYI